MAYTNFSPNYYVQILLSRLCMWALDV